MEQMEQHVGEAAPRASKPNPSSQYTFLMGYYKVAAKKKCTKQSMGSSRVPLPSVCDASVSKPSSTLVKSIAEPIPFNQYGSNVSMAEAFQIFSLLRKGATVGMAPGRASFPILVSSKDTSEDDAPLPNIDKVSKLSQAKCEEVGWESPTDWEYDDETIPMRWARLNKYDGEVENPARSPAPRAGADASRLLPHLVLRRRPSL
jgi:hypothetical protein